MNASNTHRTGEWPAAIPFASGASLAGRLAKLGGTLAVTDHSVVFKPLFALGRTRRRRLADVEQVSPAGDQPPRLRLTSANAGPLVLMVAPHRTSFVTSWDTAARDEAVEVIAAAASCASRP